MAQNAELPVAVIGAGPVGLAAAARLIERDIEPLIFEKGASAGAAVLEWGHVRVFSPWKYNIDDAARVLLEEAGWSEPDPDHYPNGREIVEAYLASLSKVPRIAGGLKLGATFQGTVRSRRGNMDMTGTFMPAYGINSLFGQLPLIGAILGNGRDRGLLGITFKLEGPYEAPKMTINPLSLIAPGVFRNIFEFQ